MNRWIWIAFAGLAGFAEGQDRLDDQWIAFSRAGAPNSNLQCFSPKNVSLLDGILVITTKPEASSCSSIDLKAATFPYSSGFVAMRKFNFLYGTVTVRAKFGGGNGTGAWPIVWMEDASCQASDPTGTDDDCNSQEIDVAEILDSKFTQVNQQIHVDGMKHEDGCKPSASDVSRDFHVYELEWLPGSLNFKIDGMVTCSINRSWIPDSPMFVKIDTFVGSYGGPVNNASLPWTTMVDYVKVRQGSKLIFNDGFSADAADRPVPIATPLWAPQPRKRSLMLPIGTACLVILAAAAVYQLRGRRN